MTDIVVRFIDICWLKFGRYRTIVLEFTHIHFVTLSFSHLSSNNFVKNGHTKLIQSDFNVLLKGNNCVEFFFILAKFYHNQWHWRALCPDLSMSFIWHWRALWPEISANVKKKKKWGRYQSGKKWRKRSFTYSVESNREAFHQIYYCWMKWGTLLNLEIAKSVWILSDSATLRSLVIRLIALLIDLDQEINSIPHRLNEV